ncbi:MAG: beta-ketoacyl-ACP synthase II [Candidatus Glassbacteria bacterium]
MQKRVVITGMGIVSPYGVGCDVFWDSISRGVSGIGPITSFDPSSFTTRIGGEVKDFNAGDFVSARKSLKYMVKATKLGLAAAKMAVDDSGLDLNTEDPSRIGVITGTGTGNIVMFNEIDQGQFTENPQTLSPLKPLRGMPNSVSIHIALQHSIQGYNNTIGTTCAAGTQAIGDACLVIERGWADAMIAGGADASLNPIVFGGYCALGTLSRRNDTPKAASRPFDRFRDGFVLSDGAAMFVIEEIEHARKRGARVYGEILGYGASCDSFRLTDPPPDGKGALLAIEQAFREAGISPSEVQYINAHGTATRMNDIVETRVIKTVFGDDARGIPVSSTKSLIGHAIGAAGAMELVGLILTMQNSLLTPTVNLNDPDPECDLDYVPNEARECDVNIALKNSFGFGGQNAVLILRRDV